MALSSTPQKPERDIVAMIAYYNKSNSPLKKSTLTWREQSSNVTYLGKSGSMDTKRDLTIPMEYLIKSNELPAFVDLPDRQRMVIVYDRTATGRAYPLPPIWGDSSSEMAQYKMSLRTPLKLEQVYAVNEEERIGSIPMPAQRAATGSRSRDLLHRIVGKTAAPSGQTAPLPGLGASARQRRPAPPPPRRAPRRSNRNTQPAAVVPTQSASGMTLGRNQNKSMSPGPKKTTMMASMSSAYRNVLGSLSKNGRK